MSVYLYAVTKNYFNKLHFDILVIYMGDSNDTDFLNFLVYTN